MKRESFGVLMRSETERFCEPVTVLLEEFPGAFDLENKDATLTRQQLMWLCVDQDRVPASKGTVIVRKRDDVARAGFKT